MSQRSLEEVQQQYQQLCVKAGHIQYQIYAFNKDLDLLNKEILDLNLEAAKIREESAKKLAEAEAVEQSQSGAV